MPIQYDGRSLVPDLSQSLKMALGIGEKLEEKARDDETLGIASSLNPTGGMGALMNGDNRKSFARLMKLNPQMAQAWLTMAEANDHKSMETAKAEGQRALRMYEAIYNEKDSAARSRFIAENIRQLESEGKPANELRSLIGLKPDQQRLRARAMGLAIGDFDILTDNSMKALKEQLDAQKSALDLLQAQRDAAAGKESDVGAMRDDYTKLSQPFIGVRDAYARVRAAAVNPSPAGDLGLIFNYVKMLDPTSTVRESEFAQAAQAGDFGDKIKAAVGKVQSGELLTPSMRADFVNRSGELYRSQKAAHGALREQYSGLAQRRGFPAADVVLDYNVPGLDDPLPNTAGPAGDGKKRKQIGRFTVTVQE